MKIFQTQQTILEVDKTKSNLSLLTTACTLIVMSARARVKVEILQIPFQNIASRISSFTTSSVIYTLFILGYGNEARKLINTFQTCPNGNLNLMGVQGECQKFEKKLRIVCIFDLMTKIKAQNVKFVENTTPSLPQYKW